MPYISKDHRELFKVSTQEVATILLDTGAELNYFITLLVNNYWEDRRDYQAISDIIGALEGAKREFQRVIVDPYEQSKLEANGGIY